MTKTFAPKPMTPGAPITWTHVQPDGSEAQRTGTVWSLAPIIAGDCASVWVTPDAPDARDAYPHAIAVQVPHKSARVYTGQIWGGEFSAAGGRTFAAGEAFAETHELSRSGSLGHSLARRSTARVAA